MIRSVPGGGGGGGGGAKATVTQYTARMTSV